MRIKPNRQRTVTVSFTPQLDGLYDAVLELTFYDRKREAEFVVERTLCGVARSLLSNNDNEDLSSDEEEVFLDSDDTGISVSDEDGVDLGIVERKQPDGPFDTLTTSLTIRNAEGSPSVILLKARIKTTDESEPRWVVTPAYSFLMLISCPSFAVSFDGGFHPIHPGAESTVHITFRPKFAGFFQEILTLVFYDSQRSARFIVVRTLQGTAGSRQDHNHFEYLNKEMHARRTVGQQVPPRQIKLLWPADRPRKSRKLPEYEVPPVVQAAVDNVTRPYDEEAPHLITALNTPALTMDTYAQYFKALVNVEDGHQQYVQYLSIPALKVTWVRRDVLNLPQYEVEVRQRGQRSPRYVSLPGHACRFVHRACSVEIENKDEDLLPEVMIGDFLWLDDVQDDIRYEARVTDVYVFERSRTAVLKMSLKLPTDFNLYRGATFTLRFRLNRITLRRQYHVLATSFTPQRRLLFPSVSDIKPIERRLSRAEIDDLQLFNESIRDDEQQLQTVISLLQQPKGTVPFIIYGP
jgi:helicase MOV-10